MYPRQPPLFTPSYQPFHILHPTLMNTPVTTSTIYNLLILDESGSMEIVRQTTINGFNELIQTVQGLAREFPEKKQVVTLTTFNGLGIKEKLFMQEASTLLPLTSADYRPNSMTPLHDAIGMSVSKLRTVLATTGTTNYQVLVTVLTDGEENASTEFSRPVIHQLVEELKAQGWTFTYIGANHDVHRAADGLAFENKLAFSQNEAEMSAMFRKESRARRNFSLRSVKDLVAGKPRADYFDDQEPAGSPADNQPTA